MVAGTTKKTNLAILTKNFISSLQGHFGLETAEMSLNTIFHVVLKV